MAGGVAEQTTDALTIIKQVKRWMVFQQRRHDAVIATAVSWHTIMTLLFLTARCVIVRSGIGWLAALSSDAGGCGLVAWPSVEGVNKKCGAHIDGRHISSVEHSAAGKMRGAVPIDLIRDMFLKAEETICQSKKKKITW